MGIITTARLGWVPDVPDKRDFRYASIRPKGAYPSSVDLKPWCPPVWDQGEIGSCTAQAISAALQFCAIKANQCSPLSPVYILQLT